MVKHITSPIIIYNTHLLLNMAAGAPLIDRFDHRARVVIIDTLIAYGRSRATEATVYYHISNNPCLTSNMILAKPDVNWNWAQLSSRFFARDCLCVYPDKPWFWPALSQTIDLAWIIDHPELPWCWDIVSERPNITMRHVINTIDKPWDWTALSGHVDLTHPPNLSVANYPFPEDEETGWVSCLSCNPTINVQTVLDTIDSRLWNLAMLASNAAITFADVQMLMTKFSVYPVMFQEIWHRLSYNPNVVVQDILDHPQCPWNWYQVSARVPVTMRTILHHLDLPWDWYGLSLNKSLTIHDILENPTCPWIPQCVAQRKDLVVAELLDHKDIPWVPQVLAHIDHSSLSEHVQILSAYPSCRMAKHFTLHSDDFHEVIRYPDLPWDWYRLSTRADMQHVLTYPNLCWKWEMLLSRVTLHPPTRANMSARERVLESLTSVYSLARITQTTDPWAIPHVLTYGFSRDREHLRNNMSCLWLACNIVSYHWSIVTGHPMYASCHVMITRRLV